MFNLARFVNVVFCLLLAGILSPSTAQAQGFIETFDDRSFRDRWNMANFDQGGGFVTGWRRRLAEVTIPSVARPGGGALKLTLEPAPEGRDTPYFGAQLQTREKFHYGDYEVIMTAAKEPGTVSAFFTYTGPFFGDPHDEIDLEFLGRDTTKLWINKFVDGQGLPGQWIDLGYDAAVEPVLYRFEWREKFVAWFANGTEIFRVSAEDAKIPTHPGHIFVSLWAGNKNQVDWLGKVQDGGPNAEFSVQCVSFMPVGEQGPMCAEYFENPQ